MIKRIISQAAMIVLLVASGLGSAVPALAATDSLENGGTIILSQHHVVTIKGRYHSVSFVIVDEDTMRRVEKEFELESKVRIRFRSSNFESVLYRQQNGAFIGRSDRKSDIIFLVSRSWYRKNGFAF